VYLLTVGQKIGTEKMMNDKTKLVKEAKNDKASRCCWSAYQKKIRQNAIRRNATQPPPHWQQITALTLTLTLTMILYLTLTLILSFFTPLLFCPWIFRPLTDLPFGLFTPGSFAPWLVCLLANLLPGLFTPWLICPFSLVDLPQI